MRNNTASADAGARVLDPDEVYRQRLPEKFRNRQAVYRENPKRFHRLEVGARDFG